MSRPVFEIDDLQAVPLVCFDAKPRRSITDTMAWHQELKRIISEFKDEVLGDGAHLSEKEVQDLVNILRLKISVLEGLITEEQYYDGF